MQSQISFIRTRFPRPVSKPSIRRRPGPPKLRDNVKLQDQITRPNPFLIHDEPLNAAGYIRKQYGENGDVTLIYGKLFERDRRTLITLLQMADYELGKPFQIKVSDIARAEGSRNPYEETVLGPIRESLDRLLKVQIQINLVRPSREKKLRGKFVFLEGWVDKNDNADLSLSNYLNTCKEYNLGFFFVHAPTYQKLRSPIAQSLYVFLQSQRHGRDYEISLEKLCRYINYRTEGCPWYQIRPHINKALNELQKVGIIGEHKNDQSRQKEEGGKMIIHLPAFADRALPEPETSAADQTATKTNKADSAAALAQRLMGIREAAEKKKIQPSEVNRWAVDIRKWIKEDGVDPEEIEAALEYHKETIDGPFGFKIRSGQELREKFHRLQDVRRRNDPKARAALEKEREQQAIDRLGGDWNEFRWVLKRNDHLEISPITVEKIIQWWDDGCEQGLYFLLSCYSINNRTVYWEAFIRWLVEQNTRFSPQSITPPDGYLWKRFLEDVFPQLNQND